MALPFSCGIVRRWMPFGCAHFSGSANADFSQSQRGEIRTALPYEAQLVASTQGPEFCPGKIGKSDSSDW